jgi:type VI secretion system secreted protein VgrG
MGPHRIDIRLESPDFEDVAALEVVALDGEEAIGRLFHFDLEVEYRRREGRVDVAALRGIRVAIVFEEGGELVRKIWGVVTRVVDRLNLEKRWRRYGLRVEPRAHALGLVRTQDIFLDMTVPAVIEDKLGRVGLAEAHDLRLGASYPEREFVVQYDETDLAFVSRLAEHLGVGFFFEHGDEPDEGDRMVWSDGADGYPELEEAIVYQERNGRGLHAIEATTTLVSSTYVVMDYNYRTPVVDLTARADVAHGFAGGITEYGPNYRTAAEGRALAAVRAEEVNAGELVYRGESDRMVLRAGHHVRVESHPELAHPRLLLVRVRHRVRLRSARGDEDVKEIDRGYENDFDAVPDDRTYRPPRVTPRPRMSGYYTALIEPDEGEVVGPSAELDGEGRYRIKLLFDTVPREGKCSKRVRMSQPHAGPGHGMHFPLRPGVEVAIVFANGDVDRPIIVGALPNPVTPSPTVDKNSRHNILNTVSGIRMTMRDSR